MGINVDERRQVSTAEAAAVQLSSFTSKLGVKYVKYTLPKSSPAELEEDELTEIEQLREASIRRNQEEKARLWAGSEGVCVDCDY